MNGGKKTGLGISISALLQTSYLWYVWHGKACQKTAGNGVTASWVFQKFLAMQGSLDLHLFRTMLGWISLGVLVNHRFIWIIWDGLPLALGVSHRLSTKCAKWR